MRKWGMVISVIYALMVLILLTPIGVLLAGPSDLRGFSQGLLAAYRGGALSWLLRGSILELLVAVPCHIIVRRRHDCSAPIITSFEIVTGIAIMLCPSARASSFFTRSA
jgi:hypothetical protein